MPTCKDLGWSNPQTSHTTTNSKWIKTDSETSHDNSEQKTEETLTVSTSVLPLGFWAHSAVLRMTSWQLMARGQHTVLRIEPRLDQC